MTLHVIAFACTGTGNRRQRADGCRVHGRVDDEGLWPAVARPGRAGKSTTVIGESIVM